MFRLACLLMLLADLVVQQPNPYEVIVTEPTATSTGGATQTATPVSPTNTPIQTPTMTQTATSTPTPVVSNLIVAPTNGQVVAGVTPITVNPLSGHWLTIYINGGLYLNIPVQSQYTVQWNSKSVANGPCTISVKSDTGATVGSTTIQVSN